MLSPSVTERLILNPIMEFEWAGWRATSLQLQQRGWRVAVHEEPFGGHRPESGFRFVIDHPELRIKGVSKFIEFDYYERFRGDNFDYHIRGMVVPFQLANDIVIQLHETEAFTYKEVDCKPTIVERQSINEFCMFQNPGQEIILSDASIDEMLAQIQAKQEPTQKEIRQRMLNEQKKSNIQLRTVHAQLITLAS